MDHLDGLRGVAAAAVVAFHLAAAFVPDLVSDYQRHPPGIARSPLALLWNGHFAVLIFFTLSGMILTGAARRRDEPFWSRMALRYLRLAVPAAASVVVAWGLLRLFPAAATGLRARTGSDWLLWTYQRDIPGLPAALFDGFVAVFLWGGSFFNNALWTMRPELAGSALCLAVALPKEPPVRVALAGAAGLLAVCAGRPEYLCFVFGILLAEAQAAGRLRPGAHGMIPATMPAMILGLGLLIGSQTGAGAGAFGGLAGGLAGYELLHPAAAAAVLYGCTCVRPVRRALCRAVPQFLGKISFPLYLLHVPLIYTVLAQACLATAGDAVLFAAALALWLAGLVALAWAAADYAEEPFLAGLRRLRGGSRQPPRPSQQQEAPAGC